MNIALVTPAGKGSRAGNRHTALRWAAFLRAAGHQVSVACTWDPGERTDLLLALHARRSHDSISAFAARHPDRPLVVALTGTDLYRDIHVSDAARASLELAHRLIVLQPKGGRELPPRLRSKVRVVIQSSATALRQRPARRGFRLCVLGHLREEKDPLRALEALAHVPREAGIHIVQLGAALDEALASRARQAMARDARYRWLGNVSHARALAWLASSHAMVISSRMEGGANVVCEALRIGVPILASRIPGNLGMLGSAYPGYFPVGNEHALAKLMLRAARNPRFYAALKREGAALRPNVAPLREARHLVRALLA